MEAAVDQPRRRRRPRRKQRKDIQDRATTTTILELPSHITSEILSRLPLKSIFNCKRVCSSFRSLTLDPHFAQLQLPRSPLCQILFRPSDGGRPTYIGFLPLHGSLVDLRRRRAIKFETPIEIPGTQFTVVNSCNGLICLSDFFCRHNVYVCNPITRQHFCLPESKNEPGFMSEQPHQYHLRYGLGYSRSAHLFKVVKFTANFGVLPFRTYCSIYTLEVDDEWRTVGDAGLPFPHNRHFVFLNGAFHWIGRENTMWFICYLDMEKEQRGNLPLPSQFSGYDFHLGVIDNCLYISDVETSSVAININIWVMKDYGNIESWSLQWNIPRQLLSGLGCDLKPVKTLEDGTLLMIVGNITLASYDPVSRVIEKIRYINGARFWKESIAGVPSFLPLP